MKFLTPPPPPRSANTKTVVRSAWPAVASHRFQILDLTHGAPPPPPPVSLLTTPNPPTPQVTWRVIWWAGTRSLGGI